MTTRLSSAARPRPAPRRWRGLSFAAALVGAVLVAACGGSAETQDEFEANRIIALGDENSLLVDPGTTRNGRKYSVNGTVSDTDASIDCNVFPLWVQVLASQYNLRFPECNVGGGVQANPQSRMRATYGARAADLSTQIGTQLAESAFRSDDLVTVLVGSWDVINAYGAYPAKGEDDLVREVEAAAAETARQVNRLADLDARVLISTIPDISYSPWARREAADHTDTDRAALIRRLVLRYNAALRSNIRNDGTHIGLLLTDELTQTVAKLPGTAGIANSAVAVCDPARSALVPPSSLDCTPLTLIPNGNATSYLWADDLHLTPGAQKAIGNLAVNRARNNPF